MARPVDAGPALIVSRDAEYREIEEWYRDRLAVTLPPSGLEWEPVKIGPTWQWDDGWVLPEATLGWSRLAWCGYWLRGKGRKPWLFTMEQARFILWYDAIGPDGEHVYHSAAMQRLKGHGKDPLAATIAASSLHAPVVFDRWEGDRPIGRDEPDAWTQVLGVSQDQTKNTMKLFPSLVSPEARAHYGIQIGKTNIWSDGDRRQIEAVTNSPAAIEGGRPKQIICNEIQNWTSSNGGHDMVGAIKGNAAKAENEAPARVLYIFNAYRPGEDSVAQRQREAWEATQGDDADMADYGLMYDSLEAPPEAPLTAAAAPAVLDAVRGDSVWLNTRRIIKDILDPQNPPSESRRKWYNQITATEDAWVTPQMWDPLSRPDVAVEPGEEMVLFLDCSKADDATALMGCRVSDGHVVTLGMWQRPAGLKFTAQERAAGRRWLTPRENVDATVQAAFEKYRVVAFWGDPSHVLDDETMDRYWDALFDEWHRRYRSRLRLWAREGRQSGHAVMFDMALIDSQKRFVEALAQTEADIEAQTLTHDGDARLRRHVLAAVRTPTRAGLSIAKRHRESPDKIDLAVAMVGARMARRAYLNTRTRRGGRVR